MKHDYTKLDAAIIDQIRRGNSQFAGLVSEVSPLADPCGLAHGGIFGSRTPPWRVVGRRLQALRRSGRILYAGIPARWHIRNPDGSTQ